jgi:uncharacterized protein (TIGR02246 family)
MTTDLTALETRIAALEVKARVAEDIEEIRALKGAYAEACDLGYDPDAMAELFTEDAVWEFTNSWGVHRGHAEIRRFMENVGKEILWALHYMIGPVITVHDETTASGKWYILELATMTGVADPAERDAVILSGTYADEYEKVDGAWKFKHVTVNIGQSSNLDQGWVRQQFRS